MITGLQRSEAIELLEACEYSSERAVEIHFGGSGGDGASSSKKTANGTKRSHKEIYSDSNEAISISDDSNSQSSTSKYDNGDGVRAPIAPTFARLCDYDPYCKAI